LSFSASFSEATLSSGVNVCGQKGDTQDVLKLGVHAAERSDYLEHAQ
jgi:hypothetical protein